MRDNVASAVKSKGPVADAGGTAGRGLVLVAEHSETSTSAAVVEDAVCENAENGAFSAVHVPCHSHAHLAERAPLGRALHEVDTAPTHQHTR